MDESDLRALLERHHDACHGWALHCCARRPADAEEVLQDAYLKVLGGRAVFEGRSTFQTWIFGVIRRTAAEHRRRGWRRLTGVARYLRLAPPEPAAPAPDIFVRRGRLQQAFQEALSSLPERQREVLHLVFYQDMTVQEAADVMGITVGSARQHYDRGKRKLREQLGVEAGSDELE